MPRTIERAKELTLPMIAVRGTVAFPGVQMNLELIRDPSLHAFTMASEGDGRILLLSQKDAMADMPTEKDFYHVGTVCRIVRVSHAEDGCLSVVFEGICRAKVSEVKYENDCFFATAICKTVVVEEDADGVTQEKIETALSMLADIQSIHPILNKELMKADDLPDEERPLNQKWSWDRILRSCFIKQAARLCDLFYRAGEHLLPRKSGIYRHYQHSVDKRQEIRER